MCIFAWLEKEIHHSLQIIRFRRRLFSLHMHTKRVNQNPFDMVGFSFHMHAAYTQKSAKKTHTIQGEGERKKAINIFLCIFICAVPLYRSASLLICVCSYVHVTCTLSGPPYFIALQPRINRMWNRKVFPIERKYFLLLSVFATKIFGLCELQKKLKIENLRSKKHKQINWQIESNQITENICRYLCGCNISLSLRFWGSDIFI